MVYNKKPGVCETHLKRIKQGLIQLLTWKDGQGVST